MWQDRQRQTLLEGREALERTSQSLARSEMAALETEAIGTNVINDLSQQRETLERSANRLENIDRMTSDSRRILNSMSRKVLTNKVVLILIIICEVATLGGVIYLKLR